MLVFLASVSQRVSHHCLSLLRGRRYLGTPELPESQPFGFLLLLDPAAERDGKGIQPGDPNSHKDHSPRHRDHSEHDSHNQSDQEERAHHPQERDWTVGRTPQGWAFWRR